MAFYFICYTIIGACFGVAGTIWSARQDFRASQLSLFWLRPSAVSETILFISVAAAPVAILTSLIHGGIWVLATIAELYIGMLGARFLIPISIMNGLALLMPAALILILGALWGFWWI